VPERRFADKKIVITGAAGVFGKWIAQAYADEGARLYLSDIREDALRDAAAKLKGTDVSLHVTDLVDEDSLNSFVQAVERDWGAPDIVINNAGITPTAR
jgi:3-oxoacyl-[acyl-carrier protein] reductase